MRKSQYFIIFLFATINILGQQIPESYSPAKNHGDKPELKRFIEQELYIPKQYIDDKIDDEVILCFVVLDNGEIRELQVSKSINSELDKIALELFDKILWIPAYYNSKAVNTRTCLTLKFSHKKYKKYVKKRGYDLPEYPFSPLDSTNKIYNLSVLDSAPQPLFAGEKTNIGDFIKKEIQYPQMAYTNNITGTVKISFIVEQSGRISNIKVVKDLGGGCDAEAMRLLKSLSWIPGYKNGFAVRTRLVFTLNFNLVEGSDLNYAPSSTLGGIY